MFQRLTVIRTVFSAIRTVFSGLIPRKIASVFERKNRFTAISKKAYGPSLDEPRTSNNFYLIDIMGFRTIPKTLTSNRIAI